MEEIKYGNTLWHYGILHFRNVLKVFLNGDALHL